MIRGNLIKFVQMGIVNKKNKLAFYIKGFSMPYRLTKTVDKKINELRTKLSAEDLKSVDFRVDYYNKINEEKLVKHEGTKIEDLKKPKTPKSYYFDTYEYARYFDKDLLIDYEFGDVNYFLPIPMICKSRPIHGDNENNILLNLDKVRHFVSVDDKKKFSDKKDILLGRAAIYQEHRVRFYEKHFNNPLCDIGQVNQEGGNPAWIKDKLSIENHLDYKFILSLEGNDVATNLKWIMSSNSIAVCPPLLIETWYMEGTLIPNQHFIGISEDFSDLDQNLNYYIEHKKEAEEIIENAKLHRNSFSNPIKEDLISLLVLKKYFELVK